MTRMFRIVTRTWNPVVGCLHNCVYCWARRQAKRQKHRCKLCYQFSPHTHLDRLIPSGQLIFVVSMGDLFCDAFGDEVIQQIIDMVKQRPHQTFLFCTKNPRRYLHFQFPENCLLGTTIETNRNELVRRFSNAPPVSERYEAMLELDGKARKFLSVEPIMEFDFDVFLEWISSINPEYCEIGYDNYYKLLPEPSLEKTLDFIEAKRKLGIDVREKELREKVKQGKDISHLYDEKYIFNHTK